MDDSHREYIIEEGAFNMNQQVKKRISTESSSFGVSKREGHDSSKFYKRKLYDLIRNGSDNGNSEYDKENTITKDEFLTFTKSIRDFPAESANKVGHPAPFSLELPNRCIQLYNTFKGDVVLDPFCGVGATCLAAVRLQRNYVGYDTNKEYVDAAIKRIDKYLSQTILSQFSSSDSDDDDAQ